MTNRKGLSPHIRPYLEPKERDDYDSMSDEALEVMLELAVEEEEYEKAALIKQELDRRMELNL